MLPLLLAIIMAPFCGAVTGFFTLNIEIEPRDILRTSGSHNVIVSCIAKGALKFSDIVTLKLLQVTESALEPIAELYSIDQIARKRETNASVEGGFVYNYTRIYGEARIDATWDIDETTLDDRYLCDMVVVQQGMRVRRKRTHIITMGGQQQDTQPLDIVSNTRSDQLQTGDGDLQPGLVSCGFQEGTCPISRLFFWPSGSYGFPQPVEGCQYFTHAKIYRFHSGYMDLQLKPSVSYNVSAANNKLRQPLYKNVNSKEYLSLGFCVFGPNYPVQASWPRGSYCINKVIECPPGFQEETIGIERDAQYQDYQEFGHLPNITIGRNTEINICCREDAPARNKIPFPVHSPFMLYQKGDQCQSVFIMTVTPQVIEIPSQQHGTGPNILINLCHYSP